ncbi:MAG: peroxidase family protein, partial [Gammaproteobacteria bacterium]
PNPVAWDNDYFDVLLGYDWELTKSPAGAHQWTPTAESKARLAPAAHDASASEPLMMTTADMALKLEPIYRPISERFANDPDAFAAAFAKAWYKLTHRDMGPYELGLGSKVPAQPEAWQDPVPKIDHELISDADVVDLKRRILESGLSIGQLVNTAWASAATFRGSDKRGGANGARLRLAPQKDWAVNAPDALARVLESLEQVRAAFNESLSGNKRVSLADVIVLGGGAAIELAAERAGSAVTVPFSLGRTDATAANTDVESMGVLEPKSDGFRNYTGDADLRSPEQQLLDRAQLLTLTAPEMTALVGGMRVLNANTDHTSQGVLTAQPETLTNDFFVNLLDMSIDWQATDDNGTSFVGRDTTSAEIKWTGSRVDLLFGSNSQLRAIAEVYAADDAGPLFTERFIKAWTKVMELDRFDLKRT